MKRKRSLERTFKLLSIATSKPSIILRWRCRGLFEITRNWSSWISSKSQIFTTRKLRGKIVMKIYLICPLVSWLKVSNSMLTILAWSARRFFAWRGTSISTWTTVVMSRTLKSICLTMMLWENSLRWVKSEMEGFKQEISQKSFQKFSSPAICWKISEEKSLKSFMTTTCLIVFLFVFFLTIMRVFSSSKLRFYCHFHSVGIYLSTTRAPTWSLQITQTVNLLLSMKYSFKFTYFWRFFTFHFVASSMESFDCNSI